MVDLTGEDPIERPDVRLQILGVGHLGPGHLQELVPGIAQDRTEPVVGLGPSPLHGAHADSVERQLEIAPEPGLAASQVVLHLLAIGDVQIRPEQAADLPVGIAQRQLARKKRDGLPFGGRLGLFLEDLGAAALDHLAVIGPIRFGLIMPPHLVIILPDEVLRFSKSGIAGEYRVTAQVNEIPVLPEDPRGYRVENPFDDLP